MGTTPFQKLQSDLITSTSINMADDNDAQHEHTFDSADAGASTTFPMQCSALRKNGFVVIKNRPCKIAEMSTSKTGKHGHAKVHLVAIDIFTDKKLEDICPSTHNMEVPNVTRQDYQMIGHEDGFAHLMHDSTSEIREDIKIPDDEIGAEVVQRYDDGDTFIVTVVEACGEEKIVGTKVLVPSK